MIDAAMSDAALYGWLLIAAVTIACLVAAATGGRE